MPRPLVFRYALAVAAGLCWWLAFPTFNLYLLAPVGIALFAAALHGASGRASLGLGLVAGYAFFVPTLSWSGIYVGAIPWLALATLETTYLVALGGIVGAAWSRLERAGHHVLGMFVLPVAWVAAEFVRGRWPWGGFPWARLAFSQTDGPLLPLARYLGAPGVSLVVAAVGVAAYAAFRFAARRRWGPMAALLALALLPWGSGAIRPPTDGQRVTVGFVQGNVPKAGLDFNAERRAVLDNHAAESGRLAQSAPDDLSLVVWPENASDIDPTRNPDAQAVIEDATNAVGAPIMVGAVLAEPPGATSNVSMLYEPGRGAVDRYTKLHPVPFAEYMPYRSFFRQFTPAVDLAGNFVAGDTIGVFDIEAPQGSYAALPIICFEVAYDPLMRDSVRAAGERPSLFAVQTNNATFGFTSESEQQFAISRFRAVEHGRTVVHASTVGVSGFVLPDGTVLDKTSLFTAAGESRSVPVRSEQTPADRLGEFWSWLCIVMLGALVVLATRRRPNPPSGDRMPARDLGRIAIFVPTYNERDSLPVLVEQLRAEFPDADLIIVDDASPDGTGELADDLAAADPGIRVLHRTAKEGLGAAYIEAFQWGLDQGYDTIAQMDADGSHRVADLHKLFDAAGESDIVIGSRWVPGGGVENWPLRRQLLSRGGNLYVRVLLGMPIQDATAGFRVYSSEALRSLGLDNVASQGYCFQTDLARRAIKAGLSVAEVPILFVERAQGVSKMSGDIVSESLRRITGWGVEHRTNQVRSLLRRT